MAAPKNIIAMLLILIACVTFGLAHPLTSSDTVNARSKFLAAYITTVALLTSADDPNNSTIHARSDRPYALRWYVSCPEPVVFSQLQKSTHFLVWERK